jgi:hypothetical protein
VPPNSGQVKLKSAMDVNRTEVQLPTISEVLYTFISANSSLVSCHYQGGQSQLLHGYAILCRDVFEGIRDVGNVWPNTYRQGGCGPLDQWDSRQFERATARYVRRTGCCTGYILGNSMTQRR